MNLDVTDLEIPSTMSTSWPDPMKLNVLHLEIRPDEGKFVIPHERIFGVDFLRLLFFILINMKRVLQGWEI